ncbi:hypothetical protein LTR37_019084 [Vermiconidia calcicola]|uniref:Uncharacterized protein n=1 Tax=Vermiconidia calcicola TaxID=1690605 RepID=A0ACC3MF64_9PEZI|nr:hypothetical protein LTR37_019084 [Vermiconidia calcicola]
MSSVSSQSIRRYILTASVTAITVTGAWYGAGLKSRQEFKKEKTAALEATPAQKIEQLESTKFRLLQQKADLQTKIDRLSAKTNTTSGDAQQHAG